MNKDQLSKAIEANLDCIRAWVDATNASDITGELACWQPDGEFNILPTGTVFHGIDEIREGGKQSAATIGGQPIDGRKQITHLDAGDDWATVEYAVQATITGPLTIQDVTLLPAGETRDLELKACLLFRRKLARSSAHSRPSIPSVRPNSSDSNTRLWQNCMPR